MKLSSRSLVVILALSCVPIAFLHADEPKPPTTPPIPTPTPSAFAKWNIRVEVLMVAMPEEKALALLPDLRDDTKIDAACARIMDAIKHKEARLTGYPVVYSTEGYRATAETNVEKIYPTQFNGSGSPTAFEKRNLGPMLTTECQVSGSGEWIQMDASMQRTELLKFDAFDTGTKERDSLSIEQPLFFSSKDSHHMAMHNGQRLLVGVHPLIKPEGETELFILQATATAAH